MMFDTRPLSSLRLEDERFTNPRTDSGLSADDIVELAIHIVRAGIITPLIITQSGLVIAGQRRYRALALLQWSITSTPEVMPNELKIDWSLDAFHERVRQMVSAVPVRVLDDETNLEGIALADNLQRKDLSSYEVAARLSQLSDAGVTGAELSRLIGKSKTYVSRKLSTFNGAGAELRAVWKHGTLTDDAVQQLAELSTDEQIRALRDPPPRAVRGPANRPGIDTVKDLLDGLENDARDAKIPLALTTYAIAVLDTLRWVTGQQSSAEFARLADGKV